MWPKGLALQMARLHGVHRLLGSSDMSESNRTLGAALPWAIAASIVRPAEKVLSICGDGGFLFSAAELETAIAPPMVPTTSARICALVRNGGRASHQPAQQSIEGSAAALLDADGQQCRHSQHGCQCDSDSRPHAPGRR
jgi:thiamine pyrophosphate-dependent acetolactate synthase large subunit-like protein